MKPRKLLIVILLGLTIVSSGTIWKIIHDGHAELWSLYFNLAVELLGGIITIILFDMIIGSRQRRSETKTLLMRDLYSVEEEIRILALDQLLNERLLNGTILKNVDIHTLNVNKRVFEEITFFKCNFFGSQLEGAIFKKCKFVKTNFSGANLNNATIINCRFENTELSGSFFEYSSISDSAFEGCDISNSKFTKTNLLNTIFNNCTANSLITSELNMDDVSQKSFPK